MPANVSLDDKISTASCDSYFLTGPKLLKPVENQHADLEQEATETREIFSLRSPLRAYCGRLRECGIRPGGMAETRFRAVLFFFA
jgi:hypothetical protein